VSITKTEGWERPCFPVPAADGKRGRTISAAAWQADCVEPVEINAGAWYLRALRADDRVDDRPALADLGERHPDYVRNAAAQWDSDAVYSWAVCEPTTGELLAEVTLDTASGTIGSRVRPGHQQAGQTATEAVRRFAEAILGTE
jgi:hypothetical protein